jgi:hypothetical protein
MPLVAGFVPNPEGHPSVAEAMICDESRDWCSERLFSAHAEPFPERMFEAAGKSRDNEVPSGGAMTSTSAARISIPLKS